jgi:hypothetical protein
MTLPLERVSSLSENPLLHLRDRDSVSAAPSLRSRQQTAVKTPDITELFVSGTRPNLTPIRKEQAVPLWILIRRRFQFSVVCLKHTWQLIRRNKLNYCLGFSSCLTLVLVIALVQSVLAQAPVIFLRVAEQRNGEVDMRLNLGGWSGFQYLNQTLLTETMIPLPSLSYNAPRYDMTFNAYSGAACRNLSGHALNEPQWKYLGASPGDPCANRATSETQNCVARHCARFDAAGAAITSSARLFLIDFAREQAMGCGRQWTLPAPAAGSAYVFRGLAQDLSLSVGDTLLVHVTAMTDFGPLFVAAAGPNVTRVRGAGGGVARGG